LAITFLEIILVVLGRDTNNKRRDTIDNEDKERYDYGNNRENEEKEKEQGGSIGLTMSNLETRLKSYKTEPQSKEKALANLEKLKEDIGMKGMRSNREEVEKILERAGSLADELINLKKEEEAKRAL